MRFRSLLVPVLLLSLSNVHAFAADTPKEEVPALQTAVFQVPDVAEEGVVQALTKALAKEEGLVSAKAEAEAGRFLVTFETARTNTDALAAAIVTVSPEAKLEMVKAAEAKAAHDCGKCPSKSTCGKAKDDHAKSPS
ncbi:hypothetical protein K8I85_01205 [bacterium]|nr:hypothetical protein [bacterium]